jgi:hypothetical protein
MLYRTVLMMLGTIAGSGVDQTGSGCWRDAEESQQTTVGDNKV